MGIGSAAKGPNVSVQLWFLIVSIPDGDRFRREVIYARSALGGQSVSIPDGDRFRREVYGLCAAYLFQQVSIPDGDRFRREAR